MKTCPACKNKGGVTFDCIECCLRWLAGMTREVSKANAHMIERLGGTEMMNKVREQWVARKLTFKGE